MKPFVTLSIVLARKGFPAHCTHEWALVGMNAKMRAKVISASKSFRAQITLEGRRMFLNQLGVTTVCRCGAVFRIRKSKYIVSIW
jgi:hypothetical protein